MNTEERMKLLRRSFGLATEADYPEQVLEEVSLDGIAKYIRDKKCKKIVTVVGAGISTASGIPDFRSPGTGLFDNLAKYNLPTPSAIFSMDYLLTDPKPFFQVAKSMWPESYKPTASHYFIKFLHDKGILLRHYTQNIDSLERLAGLHPSKLVEAHGSFLSAKCLVCNKVYSKEWMKDYIFQDKIPYCTADDCKEYQNIVKPDITFYGEALPARFYDHIEFDLKMCDLLIVMGTSLNVHPFALIMCKVKEGTPRLLINMEELTTGKDPIFCHLGMGHGFRYDCDDNFRDVFYKGKCDDGCMELVEKIGWGEEFKAMLDQHSHLSVNSAKDDSETVNDRKLEESNQQTGASANGIGSNHQLASGSNSKNTKTLKDEKETISPRKQSLSGQSVSNKKGSTSSRKLSTVQKKSTSQTRKLSLSEQKSATHKHEATSLPDRKLSLPAGSISTKKHTTPQRKSSTLQKKASPQTRKLSLSEHRSTVTENTKEIQKLSLQQQKL